MKRFFIFLAVAVLFASCDDGDLAEVSFEFDDSAAQECNATTNKFFIYKTTDQRALILEVLEKNFTQTLTVDTLQGAPFVIDLNNSGSQNPGQLIYRVYNDDITSSTICSSFPASYPVVTEESTALGGKISVVTTALKSLPDANGATKITEYLYTLNFSDISFQSQRNESLPTVTFKRTATPFEPFDTATAIQTCGDDLTFLFKNNGTQALILTLSQADAEFLFSTVLTTDEPKTRFLGGENVLTHNLYAKTATTPVTEAFLCDNDPPNFPTIKHSWVAENGSGENGVIEVVTSETTEGNRSHVVTLRNVKMIRGNQNFLLKSEFVFGEFETIVVP
ncbi:hypothetical protein [Flavobacterium soli]|uniref:hypothetical protein n=1 Tax=Flavobacterium soli TaxID=344881 RepID=UPI0012FCA2DA|nr:hypothetical protein [Flavobacterium soli]